MIASKNRDKSNSLIPRTNFINSAFYIIITDAVMSTLVLYLLAKSAISATFLIIYPFAGELYPTQMRGVGIGTSSYIGGLGLIVIPFVTYLVSTHNVKSCNNVNRHYQVFNFFIKL